MIGDRCVDHSRLEGLRGRIRKDPSSLAFAQLAEEYRRAGRYKQAIEVCRTGLAIHDGYLSAHVTLGRALLEVGRFDEAQQQLEFVLRRAPDNLVAGRGLAEIHRRLHTPFEVPAQEFADAAPTLADANALWAKATPPTPTLARESAHPPVDPAHDRATRTIAALTQWLDAVHVARADRHP